LIPENQNGKLYIPVSPSARPSNSTRDGLDNDHMDLEDTKHKVYIYDLDKELEGCESDEDKPIFIPDIEKHLNKLPKVVLIGDDAHEAAKNMQMVLYRVPTSLTVPRDKDNVRKVIIESRQRMRNQKGLTVPAMASEHIAPASRTNGANEGHANMMHGYNMRPRQPNALQVPTMPPEHLASKATVNGYSNDDYDPDLMEMD
jgi:hypothetical protein